jgi:hypothetical protein
LIFAEILISSFLSSMMQLESIQIFCHLLLVSPPTYLLRGSLPDMVLALVEMFNVVPSAPLGHQECIYPRYVHVKYVSSFNLACVIITPGPVTMDVYTDHKDKLEADLEKDVDLATILAHSTISHVYPLLATEGYMTPHYIEFMLD